MVGCSILQQSTKGAWGTSTLVLAESSLAIATGLSLLALPAEGPIARAREEPVLLVEPIASPPEDEDAAPGGMACAGAEGVYSCMPLSAAASMRRGPKVGRGSSGPLGCIRIGLN